MFTAGNSPTPALNISVSLFIISPYLRIFLLSWLESRKTFAVQIFLHRNEWVDGVGKLSWTKLWNHLCYLNTLIYNSVYLRELAETRKAVPEISSNTIKSRLSYKLELPCSHKFVYKVTRYPRLVTLPSNSMTPMQWSPFQGPLADMLFFQKPVVRPVIHSVLISDKSRQATDLACCGPIGLTELKAPW